MSEREDNPLNTPYHRERTKLEKKGLSESEVANALHKKWPDMRHMYCYVDRKEQRTAYIQYAKELIRRGLAINYSYESKEEMRQYTERGHTPSARMMITVKDRETKIPAALAEEIGVKHDVWFDCYDDDGPPHVNPEGGRKLAANTTTVRIPEILFHELWALEVDTFAGPEESGPGRTNFVEAMESAEKADRYGHNITLNEAGVVYALSPNGALRQHTDIWADNSQMGNDMQDRIDARKYIAHSLKVIAKLEAQRESNPGAPPTNAAALVSNLRF